MKIKFNGGLAITVLQNNGIVETTSINNETLYNIADLATINANFHISEKADHHLADLLNIEALRNEGDEEDVFRDDEGFYWG